MPKKEVKPKRTRKPRVPKGPVFKVVKPSIVSQTKSVHTPSSEERIISLMNKQAADNLRQQQTLLGSLVSGIAALVPSTAKLTASTMPKPETGHVKTNEELLKAAQGYKEAESKHRYLKKKEEEYAAKHGDKPTYTESGMMRIGPRIIQDPFGSYQPTPISTPARRRPVTLDELQKTFGGGGGGGGEYNSSSEEEEHIVIKSKPKQPKPTTIQPIKRRQGGIVDELSN